MKKIDTKERLMVVELCIGDLVTFDADAIVCPAHFSFHAGSSLCGAIHKAAGRELEAECQELRVRIWGRYNYAFPGAGIITGGYRLRARRVIHIVSPRAMMLSGDEDSSPRFVDCIDTMVSLAKKESLSTVAMPCLGMGMHKWSRDRAVRILVQAIKDTCREPGSITKLFIVCPDEDMFEHFEAECNRIGFDPLAIEGETESLPRRRYALRQDS